MTLPLATPPRTPLVGANTRLPSAWLPRLAEGWRRVAALWFEHQDWSGTATLTTYLLSASSTLVALAFTADLVPFDAQIWSAVTWFVHRFANLLWALPIALGLASGRRLPRLLAGFSIALAAVYYGWDWLPFGFSPSTPIKVAYILSAAVIVLPAWVWQLCRRRQSAA